MNAGVAIGLAPKTLEPSRAGTARAAGSTASRRKTLALAGLAVAGFAAGALWFKAAMVIREVLASLDAAYQAFYT